MSTWISALDAPVGDGASGWLAFGLAALSTLQAIALAYLATRTRSGPAEPDRTPLEAAESPLEAAVRPFATSVHPC